MRSAARTACILIALVTVSGCGTVGNMFQLKGFPEYKVYGGVENDLDAWSDIVEYEHSLSTVWFYRTLIAIDLPLSIIADTVTLPITVPARMSGWKGTSEQLPASSTD